MKIVNFFAGKKTYIVGVLMLLWAIAGLIWDFLGKDQTIEVIFVALGLMGLRAGVAKK